MSKRELNESIRKTRTAHDGAIDRFLTKFAPTVAARRSKARVEREQSIVQHAAISASTSYNGGSSRRNVYKGASVNTVDPDTENDAESPLMRGRARDLYRNNAIARGAGDNVRRFVVGDCGPTINPQIDGDFLGLTDDRVAELEKLAKMEWKMYFNSIEFDLERCLTGVDMLDQASLNQFISGDVFTVKSFLNRAGSPYGVKWQNIEADLCTNPDRIMDGNAPDDKYYPTPSKGETIKKGVVYQGIERDEKTNEPLAYFFQNKFDYSQSRTSSKKELTWSRVPAFDAKGRQNVLHVHEKTRPRQSRGVTKLAPVLESLKQLGRYTEAELMAAVVSGLFTIFITSPEGRTMNPVAKSDQTSDKDESIEMANGNVVALKTGEEVSSASPGRPNENFEGFFDAIVQQIGVGLGQPKEVLMKNFQSSYSAARAALLEAWREFGAIRCHLERVWLTPIYRAFFEESVAINRFPAAGFLRADYLVREVWTACFWTWPARGMIRPEVEIKGITQAIDGGLTTREQGTAQLNGGNYDANQKQRAREARLEREIDEARGETENDNGN